MSRPMLPVETTCTPSPMFAPSLRRMMDPLPYSFSMVATARSMALALFFGSSMSRKILRACSAYKPDLHKAPHRFQAPHFRPGQRLGARQKNALSFRQGMSADGPQQKNGDAFDVVLMHG